MILRNKHRRPENPRRESPGRRGFTIVELLVAAAVSIFLMVIITTAFQVGIDTFRKLKAQGDMQERLRITTIIMRDDLTSWHFGRGQYLNKQPLNTAFPYNTNGPGWLPPDEGFFRIYQGPENLADPNAATRGNPFIIEGTDSDNIIFSRATKHALHFAVLRQSAGAENRFRTLNSGLYTVVQPKWWIYPSDYIDGSSFSGQWAEVAYFLVANGESANGTPLYTLYRRQKLLLPDEPQNVDLLVAPNYQVPAPNPNPEISSRNQLGTLFYNRAGGPAGAGAGNPPTSITQPRYRFGMAMGIDNLADPNLAGLFTPPYGPPGIAGQYQLYPSLMQELPGNNNLWTNDVMTTNVISFEIKASWDSPNTGAQPNPYLPQQTYQLPNGSTVVNTDYPYDYLPVSPTNLAFAIPGFNPPVYARVFDTWSKEGIYGQGAPTNWSRTDFPGGQGSVCLPLRIRINALQIRIKIWDNKTEQVRQVTIIQDV